MNYSKKKMQPLIDKFGINPEKNKLFEKICELFNGLPNYQFWGVKVVFSQAITYYNLKKINTWIGRYGNLISRLEKKNVVSYVTSDEIKNLFKEMKGIEMISFIKSEISHFNTEQRKMLTDALIKDVTPLQAESSNLIKKWYKIFRELNGKTAARKKNLYKTSSAIDNIDDLLKIIKSCLSETYVWEAGKEDLLSFVEKDANDCEIVFNEGSCVILRVPSFMSSYKLCGGARTAWCICREEDQFESYVSHGGHDQYFLFDFSRLECDAFAHIGFTVSHGTVIEAQTCHNFPMLHEKFEQGDEAMDIKDVFAKFNIPMSIFKRLPFIKFEWDKNFFLNMAEENPDFSIVYNKDGKMVLRLEDARKSIGTLIVNNFFINYCDNDYYENRGTFDVYLYLNFNLDVKDDKAFYLVKYTGDKYGTTSFCNCVNLYQEAISKEDALKNIEINESDFTEQGKLSPSILLHKYIDEGREDLAIELIENNGKEVDINFEFDGKTPIFSAIGSSMSRLFEVIINRDEFNHNAYDSFGETLLSSALFALSWKNISKTRGGRELVSLIRMMVNCDKFNLNQANRYGDTPLSIACAFPSELWFVKKLIANPMIDINTSNCDNKTPLMVCMEASNTDAIELIGSRPDLKITENDIEFAKRFNINLEKYIAPNEHIFEYEYSISNYN